MIIHNHRLDKDQVQERLHERQEQQKQHYDKHAQDLPPLIPGDPVTVQNHINKQWSPAVIRSICPEPRSYIIKSHNGRVFRRNRRDIRSTAQRENHNEHRPHRISITEPDLQNTSPAVDSEGATPVPHRTGLTANQTQDQYITRYGRTVKRTEKLGV